MKNSIKSHGMFNIIHSSEIIKIDFIIRKESEYRKTEFSRRKKFKFGDGFIYIVSIEDLIISKLIWSRGSRSAVQMEDISNLMQEKTDKDYLKKWSEKLGIDKLLEEI
jgi:hypothetical protein